MLRDTYFSSRIGFCSNWWTVSLWYGTVVRCSQWYMCLSGLGRRMQISDGQHWRHEISNVAALETLHFRKESASEA
jgi:hypothetical protein